MPPVQAWVETVVIPTYRTGEPNPNPMFLEKRVYQGSRGTVYPHPVIDRVFDEREDREWTALFLENQYLKIMILPELGGRVQMALDKTNDYQSVFPPDVHAVMDHGKRAVSDFPTATGTYYKVDYAPGKKQWTWGTSDFGLAWDRQLTDEDGSYIELMCGAFTDNQPDFAWLLPGETKSFTQVFMPYKHIGACTNATREAVVNLQIEGRQAMAGVYVSRARHVRIELFHDPAPRLRLHNHKNLHLPAADRPLSAQARRVFEVSVKLDPETTWQETVSLPEARPAEEWTLRVLEGETLLVAYTPYPAEDPEIPAPASAAALPETITSNEELFLTGQHLEQYRHATFRPEPYYLEALRRDPGDSRCHNAMGLLCLRRGCFREAENHLRQAVARSTCRNPNPYDSEPYVHLGQALVFQERFEEAFDVYYKAVWSEAWKSPAYFELARLTSRRGAWEEALDLVQNGLEHNAHHLGARHLQVALYRRLGRRSEAEKALRNLLRLSPLDPGAREEARHLEMSLSKPAAWPKQSYDDLEIGLCYLHAGLFEEAGDALQRAAPDEFMARYYLAWMHLLAGDEEAADTWILDSGA